MALIPPQAQAQNTAEAAITLQERTIFLSADNSASALPMVTHEGETLQLTFAQLHLGFPLPPALTLTLREEAEVWHLETVDFDAPTLFIVTAAPAFRLSLSEEGQNLTLTGEALHLSPLGVVLHPLEIEVTLSAD